MKHAGWFLVLSAGLALLAITTTRIHTDITDFFFHGDDADSAFLVNQLQSDELARRYLVGFSYPDLDEEAGFDFLTAVRQRLEADPDVQRVNSGRPSEAALRQLIQVYAPHHVQLFSLQPEQDFPTLFSTQGLDAQALRVREALLGPDPQLAKSLLHEDPMLLTLNWLQKLGRSTPRPLTRQGYSVLFVDTRIDATDTAAQARFQQRLQTIFKQLDASLGDAVHMEVTGVPVFAVHIKNAVAQDIQRVSILSAASVALLFLLVFRSGRALLVTALLMLTTLATAVLVTDGVFGYVHGLTLALGTTLIGVCIDYPIHAMVHASEAAGAATLQRLWSPMILAGITTVIGYAALAMSGFPGLQQIALFSATGILTALLLTRFALPGLIAMFHPSLHPRLSANWLLAEPVTRILRPGILVVAAVVVVAGDSRLHWSSDLNTLSPDLEQLRQRDRSIRTHLVTVEPGRFLLVSGNNIEQALQSAEQLIPRLRQLHDEGVLDAFFPVYPLLASRALQQRNETQWNEILDAAASTHWRQALERHGLNARTFPPLQPERLAPLQPADLKGTSAWPLISSQLVQLGEQTAAIIWLGHHDPGRVRRAVAGIPQVRYFSQKDSITRLATRYREHATTMLLLGMLTILLLLAVRYRSLRRALQVLAPAAASILIVMGAWGLVGVPLGMLHLVGLLLAAAICVDYGIFFADNRVGDRRITFQAIMVSALTSAVSFGALGAAQTPALHALAWTVAPAVLLGFLLCPLMLRGRVSC